MSFEISAATGLPGQLQTPATAPQAPSAVASTPLTPPVSAAGNADTGNRTGQGDPENRDAPSPQRMTRDLSNATPYIALPTVDAAMVEAEAARIEARERMAPPPPPADAEPAKTLQDSAIAREATAAKLAEIQPAPENAPSIGDDAQAIRTAQVATDPAPKPTKAPPEAAAAA